ncbi:MAG TPA: hypothetical protein DDZ51_07250 [Planctomycetaceae bacterium]|nr:hypothetical protein [Planctomycetaceae bacterium]
MSTPKNPCKQGRSTAISRRLAIAGLIAFPGMAITASPVQAISPSDLVRQLVNASWPAAAATKVAAVQSPIQMQIALADPALAESRLERLKELGKYPVAMRLMISHPHLAGFIMHASDPMRTAEILSQVADSAPAMNSLMMYAGEADQVIAAFEEHRKSLFRLPRDGEPIDHLPVNLFLGISPKETAYIKFVDDLLIWTAGDSFRRAAVVGSLTRQSDQVRALFRAFPERSEAAAAEWMKFCDAHPDHGEWMCGQYFEIDDLLRFFMLPRSREMADHAGVQAMILHHENKLATELVRILPPVVLKSDPQMLDAISKLKEHYGLVSLLGRKTLSSATLKAALLAAEANTEQLAKWTSFSDAALAREVGTADIGAWEHVPFVEIAVKIVDGRELTAMDGVFVAVDITTTIFPLVKGGAAGLRSAGSVVRKDVIEVATKTYGKEIATKASKMTIKQLQQELPDVFEAAAKKAMRQRLKKGGLDVTGLIRLSFEQVGKRSKSFKKFTGLDSRVFMRSDRVVVIYPHQTMVGLVLRGVIEGESAVMAIENSGDTIIESKERIEGYTQKLGTIWIGCNEPDGIGEVLLKK